MNRVVKLEPPELVGLIELTRGPAEEAWAEARRDGVADPVVLVLVVDSPRSPAWRLTVHPRRDAVHRAASRDPAVARWLAEGPGSGGMQVVYLLPGDTPIVELPRPWPG